MELDEFNAEKTQLALFDSFSKTDAIDVKMEGSVLEENYFLR